MVQNPLPLIGGGIVFAVMSMCILMLVLGFEQEITERLNQLKQRIAGMIVNPFALLDASGLYSVSLTAIFFAQWGVWYVLTRDCGPFTIWLGAVVALGSILLLTWVTARLQHFAAGKEELKKAA